MDEQLNEFEKYIETLIRESVAEDKITNFLIKVHAKNLLHIADKQKASQTDVEIAEQFEYKRVFYEHGFTMRDLNNEGKNGWEICDIERLCGAREYIIFKRKKVNNDT